MIIYNVTINIDDSVHDAWLTWMRDEHIPSMLATGKFSRALMTRVLVEEETGGVTYSVQYRTDSNATLRQYYRDDADRMRAESKRFDGKFVVFRTELQVVHEMEV